MVSRMRSSPRSSPPGYAAVVAAMTAAALLVGCSCGSNGGEDGGVLDAGVDAGFDAGLLLDAGRDAAGDDAGVRQWRRVEGLPDDCVVELAVDPNAALGRLQFRGCPGDPPGCRQVVVPWRPHPELSHFSVHGGPYTGPGRTVFTYGRASVTSVEESIERFYYVAATLEGDHLVAARSPAVDFSRDAWCSIAGLLADRDEATFVVLRNPGGMSDRQYFLGRVPYASPASVTPLWRGPDLPTTTIFGGSRHIGGGIVAHAYGPPVQVYRIDREGDVDIVAPARGGEPYSELDDVVEGAILVPRLDDGGAGGTGVWWITIVRETDTSVQPFIGGLGDGSHAGAVSDGVDLVWSRGFGPTLDPFNWSRYELWTSPWSPDPARLAPRKLADIELTSIGATGGVGYGRTWAFESLDSGGGVVVYDLRGGEHRRFPDDDPTFMTMAPILGPEEIAFPIERRDGPRGYTETLRIVRYDTLPLLVP